MDDSDPQKALAEVMGDPSPLAARIATTPRAHDNDNPLWQGPCGEGPNGGITQSMIGRFLSCRERFRLKYVLGLEPHDKWSHRLGYGNMWHACEEALAAHPDEVTGIEDVEIGSLSKYQWWVSALTDHTCRMMMKYPMQRDEIGKWYNVCKVQFPEYVRYWREHPDVLNRTPLMQEQVFDVPYTLPSGRTVRLRGKFDSVDLIDGGIYLQENKTKGDIDKVQVERQLKFDLQTMMYMIALHEEQRLEVMDTPLLKHDIKGVRYNVVRRPLSGGKGSIKPSEGTRGRKCTKCKGTGNGVLAGSTCPKCNGRKYIGGKIAETAEEFYERLRRDYIAAEPDYWFFRVRSEVSARDIQVFKDTCLDPLLETVCIWYEQLTGRWDENDHPDSVVYGSTAIPPMNYRTPFGIYSALEEGGATEYDAFLETGSEAGLHRTETLFTELQDASH